MARYNPEDLTTCRLGEYVKPGSTVRHGTTSGYVYGCRGDHCTRANTIDQNAQPSAKKAQERYKVARRIAFALFKERHPKLWAKVWTDARAQAREEVG